MKTIYTGSCGYSIKCKSKIVPVSKCLHVWVVAVKLQPKPLVTQVSLEADLDDRISNILALCCKSKLHILTSYVPLHLRLGRTFNIIVLFGNHCLCMCDVLYKILCL